MKRAKSLEVGETLVLRRGASPYKRFSHVIIKRIEPAGNHLVINGHYTLFKEDPATVVIQRSREQT